MTEDYTEDELYEMDDATLEEAFKDAKAAQNEEIEVEEEIVEDEAIEEEDIAEEAVEDEDEEDLEQPEMDSDKADDTQEQGEEEAEDGDDEEAEGTDEIPDDSPEDKPDEVEEEPAISKYKIKANGTELDLTNEELIKLAPKALDYTKKMQEIAPWRKTISALKDNDMSEADVNLMIDVMKGDKEAITRIIKQHGIDTLDIDTEAESQYAPKEYGRTTQQLDIDDVISDISTDKEYEITQRVVDQQWDSKSREYFASKPGDIRVLHDDIKAGRYSDISSRAMKLRVLDEGPTKSDVEYYIEAGHQYYRDQASAEEANKLLTEKTEASNAQLLKDKEEVEAVKIAKSKQTEVKKAAKSRKAAATTKKVVGKKSVIDYLDDNDEAYDEWYKKLQDKL